MNARKSAMFALGLVLGLAIFPLMAPTSGFPSRPTFSKVKVGNEQAISSSNLVELQSPSGTDPILATFRNSSGVGVGIGRLRFEANDAGATRQTYAYIQGEIEGNTAAAQSGAIVFNTANSGAAGERMRITAAGNVLARGVAVTAYKAVATDRASTITLTADPDLQVSLGAGSRYALKAFLYVSNISTTAQSMTVRLNFAPTASDGACSLRNSVSGAATPWTTGIGFNTDYALGPFAAANTVYVLEFDCGFTAASAGTFSFNWAQSSSNANASRVGAGSYMTLTRLN